MQINLSYLYEVAIKSKAKIKTKVIYSEHLPSFSLLSNGPLFFIVDDRVYKKNKAIRKWLSHPQYLYCVKSGEALKDLKAFPGHMQRILKIIENLSHRELTLVAVGGGSLGDFAGFVAATLKRGVRFIQVPTTWLSAMDSAHGGKNALNLGSLKNQIGTFYHPDLVCISKDALDSQAPAQCQDALGELYKMALIEGRLPWAKKTLASEHLTSEFLWAQLPHIVAAKYKIVAQDPDETKGIRYVLNLGHTIGHVIELEMNISHGNAVAAGLAFALWFSHQQGHLPATDYNTLKNTPMFKHCATISVKKLNAQKVKKALLNDKKKDSAKWIKFIFLQKPGVTLTLPVNIETLIDAFNDYLGSFY